MTIFKLKYVILSVFSVLSVSVSAQNVDSLIVVGDSLRKIYRFEESLVAYDLALDKAVADSLDSVTEIQDRISCAENGKNMASFVDTPVVEARHKFSKEDFFLYYPLPDKSWRRTPNQLDTLGGGLSNALYFPDGAVNVCYSAKDTTGVRDIHFTQLMDSLWTAPKVFDDIAFALSDEIYPMISADGKTMYFASNGLYGVGGYDIYVSKWDGDRGTWGVPMNMGFPYSSPADDFLYAVSQSGGHAVFASTRGCNPDSVWVYVLKHQDVPVRRSIEDPAELLRVAELNSVGHQERIENKTPVATDIPENIDTKKYLEKITEVRALQDTITVYNERLEKDRDKYALSTDEDERVELTSRILQQEAQIPAVQEKLDKAKAQLHKIEMEFLFSGVVIDPDKLLAQADREVITEAAHYTFEKKSFGPDFELVFESPTVAQDSLVTQLPEVEVKQNQSGKK